MESSLNGALRLRGVRRLQQWSRVFATFGFNSRCKDTRWLNTLKFKLSEPLKVLSV